MKTPSGAGKAVPQEEGDVLHRSLALNRALRKVDSSVVTIDVPGNIRILNGHCSALLKELLAEHILLQNNPHLLAWHAQQQRVADGQLQVTVAEQYVKRQEEHIAHIQKLMKAKDAPLRLSNKLGTFQDGLVIRDHALQKSQDELTLIRQDVERECEPLRGPVQEAVRGFNEKIRGICRQCSELVREYEQKIKPKMAPALPPPPLPEPPKPTPVLAAPVTPPARKAVRQPPKKKKDAPRFFVGGTAVVGINIPLHWQKVMLK